MKKKRLAQITNTFYILFILGTVFSLGIYVGLQRVNPIEYVTELSHKDSSYASLSNSIQEEELVDFTPFWYAWNTLNEKFVPHGTSTDQQVVDAQAKVWSAISGLAEAYNDPYTIFFPPKEAEEFKINTEGSFKGVGMHVSLKNDEDGEQMVVIRPLPNSPALKSGIIAGDKIIAIDGEKTLNISIDDNVQKIRGPIGTEVILTIMRKGEETPLEIPIIRNIIEIPSTETSIVTKMVPVKNTISQDTTNNQNSTDNTDTPNNVHTAISTPDEPPELVKQDFFVIRLAGFTRSSVQSFAHELETFRESGTTKLIIDLRGNPGGFIDAATDMASWFLPKDAVIVRERRTPNEPEYLYLSSGHVLFNDETEPEIVVLVDKNSASASEIFAGALQDHGKATIVGEHTFGKGSIQELIEIPGNSSLKVTVARWYTPNGNTISQVGLTPDIIVDMSKQHNGFNPILDAGVDYLINKEND